MILIYDGLEGKVKIKETMNCEEVVLSRAGIEYGYSYYIKDFDLCHDIGLGIW